MALSARSRFIVAVLILLSFCGIFFILATPMHHDFGCPFMLGQEAVCSMPLAHLEHWQSSFLALVTDFAVLFALAFFILEFHSVTPAFEKQRFRSRLSTAYWGPTPVQELFSRGLLNPRPF